MRALLLILDSVSCGRAPDAAAYGDEGANTLGHILDARPQLALPNLFSLGLWKAVTSDVFDARAAHTMARWGRMREISAGKDTTTGHWEIAGAILEKPFGTYTEFPSDLIHAIEDEAGIHFLGNYPQSGTVILDELGDEHVKTGRPILYTSADSVLQIAAHERVVPLKRLYEICRIARRHADPYRIGRVIARPFLGERGSFKRTSGRHDFSIVPPPTILNAISDAGLVVHGIGKIADIFANSGITESSPTAGNEEGMKTIEELWQRFDSGLVFANLVDFDMLFGHRRDVAGYANALEVFDRWLGDFLAHVDEEDLVIITADHGNDPTWHGTDHTREEVPLIVLHGGKTGPLGTRRTYADVAATLAEFFEVGPWTSGGSFLRR
jgi:phosphopentomutase